MRSVRVLLTAIPLLLISGCADYNWKLPGVYRIPIQQGTVIEQSQVNQLKPGMAKDQVEFIMGSPVVVDPFHSNRWEYLYTFKKGSDRVREQRHITLHFNDDDKLDRVSGDIEAVPAEQLAEPEEGQQAETIKVPDDRSKPGIFSRMFDRKPRGETPRQTGGDGAETPPGTEPAPAEPEDTGGVE